MELVKLNPAEFGLTDQTAKNIQDQFAPMLAKMVELENEYNEVINLLPTDPERPKKAKEVRLKYVKIRTGTAEIHKQQKSFYLNGGRFVDGWKNAQIFASNQKENALEAIEKEEENRQKQIIENLQNHRAELIRHYVDDTTMLKLGEMPEDVFTAYLAAKKQNYLDRIEAERKAEADRIEREKQEAIERERIKVENEKLKAEAMEREGLMKIEREKAAKELAEQKAKAEAERLKIEKQRKAEAMERERLQKELDAKAEAERKEKAAKEAADKAAKLAADKAAKAPVKKQLSGWVDSFDLPKIAIDNEITKQVIQKHEAFKSWAKTQIENL
jgi:hypothetical protein